MGSSITRNPMSDSGFTEQSHQLVEDLRLHREQNARLLYTYHDHDQNSLAEPGWWADIFANGDWSFDIPNMFELQTPLEEREVTPRVFDFTPEPIPHGIVELADHIKSLRRKRNGLPSRNMLRKDDRLRGEVSRKTGVLKQEKNGSKLREWNGDARLFPPEMWTWLTEEGYHTLNGNADADAKKRKAAEFDDKPEKKRKTAPSKRPTKEVRVSQPPVECLSTNPVEEVQVPVLRHTDETSAAGLVSTAVTTDRPHCTSRDEVDRRSVLDNASRLRGVAFNEDQNGVRALDTPPGNMTADR